VLVVGRLVVTVEGGRESWFAPDAVCGVRFARLLPGRVAESPFGLALRNGVFDAAVEGVVRATTARLCTAEGGVARAFMFAAPNEL
jgi:hypothetical protein